MNYSVNLKTIFPNVQKAGSSVSSKEGEPLKASSKSKVILNVLAGMAMIAVACLCKKGLNRSIGAVVRKPGASIACKEIINSTKTEVNALIREYAKKHRGKKGFDPRELDKILTEKAKRNGIKERAFNPRPDIPQGRIKQYEMGDGTRYVLETHTTKDGNVVTRLYEETPTVADSLGNYKFQRNYLCSDGKFRTNAYMSEEAHLKTSEEGITWMNAA